MLSVRAVLSIGLALLLTLCPAPGHARAEVEVQYSKAQAFSAALRYLRIDLGYVVTEKDADAAYLMFEFMRSDQKKPGFGTIEIVETAKAVKLIVRLPELPEYQERIVADGLLTKLRNEQGEPPPRKAPAAPPAENAPAAGSKKPTAPAKGNATP